MAEQSDREKLVKKSCIWTSCNIHQGSTYSWDFCSLHFRSRCRKGIKHDCLSFERVCLCTRGTPGSREHANKKSSHDAQKTRQETEIEPQQPSVCCCALCSPAAFEQMQEALRATYQTDHTRLREQRTRQGRGYSQLLSSAEKEVRGRSSVWEVLTGKDEGAKQGRKCCRWHNTHRERKRGEREKKKDMTTDTKCWENFHLGSQSEDKSHFTCSLPPPHSFTGTVLAAVVMWV